MYENCLIASLIIFQLEINQINALELQAGSMLNLIKFELRFQQMMGSQAFGWTHSNCYQIISHTTPGWIHIGFQQMSTKDQSNNEL